MLAAFCVAVLAVVSIAGIWLGAAVIVRHRAQSVADLAALAGAARIPVGPQAACGQAQALVRTAGAELAGCRVGQLDVFVTVTVQVGGRTGQRATASARAGPAGLQSP